MTNVSGSANLRAPAAKATAVSHLAKVAKLNLAKVAELIADQQY